MRVFKVILTVYLLFVGAMLLKAGVNEKSRPEKVIDLLTGAAIMISLGFIW